MRNRLLGSTLIIAGTAVGAGMLAMPLTSAQMGFGLTFLLLCLLWILLTYTALLYAEVHQHSPIDAGLASLTEQYFGKFGRLFVNFILLFFMYAVLTAYITGSGELLFALLPSSLSVDPYTTQKVVSLAFALFFATLITLGTGASDITNRVAFILKISAFTLLIYLLLSKISITNLQAPPQDNRLFFSALPVFFMTFGFHICTPTINEYLNGDYKKMCLACICGSTGIFIIYIIWQIATHGVLQQTQLVQILSQNSGLNGLIKAFEVTTGSKNLSELVRIFSILALITSYIGVSLGLSNAVKDLLAHFNLKRDNITISLITFLPPIIVGFTYPNLFLSAFAFAGLIFAFIGILLPVSLAYCARKRYPEGKQIVGGNVALCLATFLAFIIIISYIMTNFGLLPEVTQ